MDNPRIETLATGQKIKLYRIRKDMALEDLAAELNTTRQSLSKIEQGYTMPKFDIIIDIAKIFEIDVNDLRPGKIELSDKEYNYVKSGSLPQKRSCDSIENIFKELEARQKSKPPISN